MHVYKAAASLVQTCKLSALPMFAFLPVAAVCCISSIYFRVQTVAS